jgi:hypothetical protein
MQGQFFKKRFRRILTQFSSTELGGIAILFLLVHTAVVVTFGYNGSTFFVEVQNAE